LSEIVLTTAQIQKLIPHRWPILMVDRIVEYDPARGYIRGEKAVTATEWFFQGHFPQLPVMPGVLQVEALAQTMAVYVAQQEGFGDRIGLFAAIATAQDSGETPKRGWTIPPGAAQEANPIAVSPEVLAKGKKLYEDNCQKCHGKGGKGDGPAAAALPPPKPADWTSAKVAAETDGEIFWKISNGRGAMPPWKHLPEKDRWDLVNYIRTLQKK